MRCVVEQVVHTTHANYFLMLQEYYCERKGSCISLNETCGDGGTSTTICGDTQVILVIFDRNSQISISSSHVNNFHNKVVL